jgi:hypothetical protein
MKDTQLNHISLFINIQMMTHLIAVILVYRLLFDFIKSKMEKRQNIKNFPGINIKEF